MDINDFKQYKQRLSDEYNQLLSYRGGILRQIEIDERKLSGDEKTKMIVQLQQTIKGLEEKQPDKQDILNTIQDIKAYKNRLKGEFDKIIETIRLSLIEKDKNEKEVQSIQDEKTDILQDIALQIEAEQKEISKIKQEKDDFIKGLEKRDKDLLEKSQIFTEKFKDLADQIIENENIKTIYQSAIATATEEKKKLQEADKLTTERKQELDNKILNLNKKLKAADTDRQMLDEQAIEADKNRKELAMQELGLSQKAEAIQQTLMAFETREQAIEKNRKHLESQQATLRLAFEEIKRLKK